MNYLVRKSGHLILLLTLAARLHAQTTEPAEPAPEIANPPTAEERISQLEAEVAALKTDQNKPTENTQKDSQKDSQNGLKKEDREILDFLRETTINVGIDGYYEYNFNHPVGRVNLLRAYDVLSNLFSQIGRAHV